MFKIKVYKHQKCAIYYNCFFCTLLKLISVIISILIDDYHEKSLYKTKPYLIPIGVIIYFLILIIRSYSISKIKYFMDLKYISSTRILLYSAVIGIILFTSICTIETFIECPSLDKFNLCFVKNENETSSYIDNFIIYFKVLKDDAKTINILYEITSAFFGIISYFLYLYFYLLVLKYLTPVHYVFSNAIYFFLIQIIFILYHKS